MKSLAFIILFLTGLISSSQAQSLGIPYQAIARNTNGTPYVNSNLTVRFSLHEQTATGTVSYAESHSLQTNDLGLFSTTFGSGTPITGAFAAINWAQTTKFLQVEINLGSTWVDMGTQQLMSVPYAMYAANSGSGTNNQGTRIGFGQSGSWICPAGVTQIMVQLWGAAGGGGSGSAGYTSGSGNIGCVQSCGNYGSLPYGGDGGGGGNGGYMRDLIDVVPGQTYSIIVGTGGVGGNSPACNYSTFNPGNPGTAGGLTSFGGLLSAPGGSGGQGGTSFLGGCQNGANGSNGSITNYSLNEISISIQSQSTPISYVPSGYLTSTITPGNQAGGGGGGLGGRVNQCPQGFCGDRCFCPPAGGVGQNGYCIISY